MKKFIIFFYITCFAISPEELNELFVKDELKALLVARDICNSDEKDNFYGCFSLAYWFKYSGDEETYKKYIKKALIKTKAQCKKGYKIACEMEEFE